MELQKVNKKRQNRFCQLFVKLQKVDKTLTKQILSTFCQITKNDKTMTQSLSIQGKITVNLNRNNKVSGSTKR